MDIVFSYIRSSYNSIYGTDESIYLMEKNNYIDNLIKRIMKEMNFSLTENKYNVKLKQLIDIPENEIVLKELIEDRVDYL